MTAWDTPEVPLPSRRVVEILTVALTAERYAYVRNGGGRDFRHEEAQDEAMRFVRSLGSGKETPEP